MLYCCFTDRMSVYMRQLIVMQLNHICLKMDSLMVYLLDFLALQLTCALTVLAAL